MKIFIERAFKISRKHRQAWLWQEWLFDVYSFYMNLKPEQLSTHLQSQLLPLYWLQSDQPLLLDETVQTILNAAAQHGQTDVIRWTPDTDQEWEALRLECAQQGLFSTPRILILRLLKPSLTQPEQTQLTQLVENLGQTRHLIIISPRLDRKLTSSATYKAAAALGATMTLWPPNPRQFQQWLTNRLLQAGLKTDRHGVETLARFTEGQLHLAAQSIDILALISPNATLDANQIAAMLSDCGRFELNQFTRALTDATPAQALHVLNRLLENQEPANLLLWVLHQHLQQMLQVAYCLETQTSPQTILNKTRLWDSQKRQLIKRAEQSGYAALARAVAQCHDVDIALKTSRITHAIRELRTLTLIACGLAGFCT